MQRLTGLVNKARFILRDEMVDIAKLLGIHDRLLASNADLAEINGEFAERITALEYEFEAAVQYNHVAIQAWPKFAVRSLEGPHISSTPPLRDTSGGVIFPQVQHWASQVREGMLKGWNE